MSLKSDEIAKFVTLTLQPYHWQPHIWFEWHLIKSYCDRALRDFCSYYKITPEIHRNGHIHCHLIVHYRKDYKKLFQNFLRNYKYGFKQYNEPRNYQAADRYLSKVCDDLSEVLGFSLPDVWCDTEEKDTSSSIKQKDLFKMSCSEEDYVKLRNKVTV